MPQLTRILLCIFVLGLDGCAVDPLQQPEAVQLKLLPPAEGPDAVLLKQKVTLMSEDRDQQFIAVIRLQPDRLKLVALLPSGQQLFFMEYDGKSLIEKNFSSEDLPTRDMLAIMQFALWPSLSVNYHYAKEDGWIVKIMPDQRTLLTASGVFLKVNYQAETTLIENHHHSYRLRVEPLES